MTIKPGSDFTSPSQRKKVEGVQKLLIKAIPGLKAENITIADSAGNVLNDFDGMAEMDRVNIVAKEQKLIENLENAYPMNIFYA